MNTHPTPWEPQSPESLLILDGSRALVGLANSPHDCRIICKAANALRLPTLPKEDEREKAWSKFVKDNECSEAMTEETLFNAGFDAGQKVKGESSE